MNLYLSTKRQRGRMSLGVLGSLSSIIALVIYLMTLTFDEGEVAPQPQNSTASTIKAEDSTIVSQTKSNSEIYDVNIAGQVDNVILGNNNTVYQDSNNTVNNNVYQVNREPLTEENLNILATDHVGDYDKIQSVRLIKSKGRRPYMLIIFDAQDRYQWHIQSVKQVNGQWRTTWRAKMNGLIYGVNDRSIKSASVNGRDYYIFSGCTPHQCPEGWGFLVYDPKVDKGYSIISKYSDGKMSFVFPQGLPSGYKLWDMQELFIAHMVEFNGHYLSNKRLQGVAAFPSKAQSLPDIDKVAFHGRDTKMWLKKTLATGIHDLAKAKVRNIGQYHVGDLDGDLALEWLVQDNDNEVLYIIDDNKYSIINFHPEARGASANWFDVYRYSNANSPPYIVFAIYEGAAGNFAQAFVFQYQNGQYAPVLDESVVSAMTNAFQIYGRLEQP